MLRPQLDRETHDYLKAVLDSEARATVIETDERRCGECGTALDCKTDGCRACYNRHKLRSRRRAAA